MAGCRLRQAKTQLAGYVLFCQLARNTRCFPLSYEELQMYCMRCATNNDEDATYCTECGAALNSHKTSSKPIVHPVQPQTGTRERDALPKPAPSKPKGETKRAFHPAQRYTIIGLAASFVLVLLIAGPLIHLGRPPNSSPLEARVVILSNLAGAAIHVQGDAKSASCVTPQCTLSLPLGMYSLVATTPNLPPITQSMEVKSDMRPIEITFPSVEPGTTPNRKPEIAEKSAPPWQASAAVGRATVYTPPTPQPQPPDAAARQAREAANSERTRQQQEDSELDKIIVEVGVSPSSLSARQKTAFVSNLKTLHCKCGCNETYLVCFRNHNSCGNRFNNVRHALELATE
jgi:hypothetical protein